MVHERAHKPDDRIYLAGKAAGLRWGEKATQAELEHVQRLFEGISQDPAYTWDWYFFERDPGRYTRAQQFAVDLMGTTAEEIDVEAEATAFWEEAVGGYHGNEVLNDGRFLQGFADGGLEMWDRVKDKM